MLENIPPIALIPLLMIGFFSMLLAFSMEASYWRITNSEGLARLFWILLTPVSLALHLYVIYGFATEIRRMIEEEKKWRLENEYE
jgi:cytochrome b subunit of formate dehydrogenase